MLIQTTFIKGKMNKSVDERLVPNGEYVDALNVRLGSTESTEIGAVENSRGNTALTALEYLGEPLSVDGTRCIGAFEDGMLETIYWFVHDANNPVSASGQVSMILSYNVNVETLTYHVISETVLNFNHNYLITGVNKIGNLLFFTDDLNPPRYINVRRQYNTDTVLVDPLEEEDISVIVKPPGFEDIAAGYEPLGAPYIELFDNGTTEDYMEPRFLCFGYRYRYQDCGYSATSLFTTPAFEPKEFDFSYSTFKNEGMQNRYNAARVYFSTGSRRVQEIQVLYKEAQTNEIFIIDRLYKDTQGIADNNFIHLTFTNSKILTLLGGDELLRLYDNVPRKSQAQTIQGNRLMYGNYLDQYDVALTPGGEPIEIRFQAQPVSTPQGQISFPVPQSSVGLYDINAAIPNTSIDNSVLTFDLGTTPLPIQIGTQFNFRAQIENVLTQDNGGPDVEDFTIPPFNISLTFIADQVYNTVDEMTSSQAFQNAIGTVANITPLTPYTNPTPPLYPPASPFPPQAGSTYTDTFNSTVPYTLGPAGYSNSLMLIQSAISLPCPSIPLTTFPPTAEVCGGTQEPIALRHFGDPGIATNTFSIQIPAVLYYFDDGAGNVSSQYEYFAFNAPESYATQRVVATAASLHSQRDYEVGVVYMDEYARASTVLVNETNTVFFPASTSVDQNRIKVTLEHLPPYWATHYKFVLKPSQGTYNTVFCSISFEQLGCNTDDCGPTPFAPEPGTYWFRLEGQSQNLVKVGDVLTVKMDAGGAVNSFVTAEVLDKEALYSGQINAANPAGVYIRLQPDGWTPSNEAAENNINCWQVLAMQNALETGGLPWNTMDEFNAAHYPACAVPDPADATLPAVINEGSFIRIYVDNTRGGEDAPGGGITGCNECAIEWDSGFIQMTDTYPSIHAALIDIGFQSLVNAATATYVDEMDILFDPVLYTFPDVPQPYDPFTTKIFIQEATPGGVQSVCNQGNIPACTTLRANWPTMRLRVQVNFSAGLFAFETEPLPADPNIFYDASDLLNIGFKPGLPPQHEAKRIWDPVTQNYTIAEDCIDQDVLTNQPLQTILDFYNCYSFGNGVESFRIEDRIEGKMFLLGQRALAVSNQDFQEADRESGITYSGVYSDSANSNNLNEFNLGLVNYKDLERDFGPIMKMHSRETDILVLQEDRISYVLSGKNIITDSTGGGTVASVPQVLGTQIARIEEYGISFQPESFAAWGKAMYFTDTKRGAVIQLTGASNKSDQLKVVSQFGMRSWFRDEFNAGITTQKLGGYDPYMNEYVLSSNNIQIPIDLERFPCNMEMAQTNATNNQTFIIEFGATIGVVNIPYTIDAGEITISVVWNGVTYTSGAVSGSGSFSFDKTLSSPSFAEVTISPTTTTGVPPATYSVIFECPEEKQITVIQVVVNSNQYAGQSIHTEYTWEDTVGLTGTVSPTIQNSIQLDNSLPTSSYISNTGIRSVGGFPYDGASVTLKTRKIIPDNFDFDPNYHKFQILSSNTLYEDNTADIAALLAAASDVTPIENPTPPVYQAKEVGTIQGGTFTIPDANQYLYLIWDFRAARCTDICYSNISALDACCNCTRLCGSCYFGKAQNSIVQACASNTNDNGALGLLSFTSSGATPEVGDTVFSDPFNNCRPVPGAPSIGPGYYIVGTAVPSTDNPLKWVRIGADGLVLEIGTC